MVVTLEDHLENLGDRSLQTRVNSLRVLATIYRYHAAPWEPSVCQKILDVLLSWLNSPDSPEKELLIVFLNDILEREDAWVLMTGSKICNIGELLRTLEDSNEDEEIASKIQKIRSLLLVQSCIPNSTNPAVERDFLLLKQVFPTLHLAWLKLVKSDSYVLRTLEYAWSHENTEAQVLQLCHLTREIILKDFPTEIFLQRQYIIKELFHVVDQTVSVKVRDAILQLIKVITTSMITRIAETNNPRFTNFQFKGNSISTDENATHGIVYQQYWNTYPNFTGDFNPQTIRILTQPIKGHDEKNIFSYENSEMEKGKQMTIPEFCLESMERAIEHDHMELAAALLTLWHELHVQDMWQCADPVAAKIRVCLLKTFSALGRSLKRKRIYFQEGSVAQEEEIISARRRYLFHLAYTVAMVKTTIPMGQEPSIIISDEIQNILFESIHDYAVVVLFNNIFQTLHQYRMIFTSVQREKWKKLDDMLGVLKGMEYSMKLVNSSENTPSRKTLTMIMTCIQSLEITHFWPFIKWIINISIDSHSWILENEEIQTSCRDIIVQLISHSDPEVRREMVRISYDALKTVFSEESSRNLDKSVAFLDAEVMRALINEGFADECISQCALGILVWFTRKWQCKFGHQAETVLDRLLPVFPYLQCIMDTDPSLSHHLLEILEPVQVDTKKLPRLEILKGNIRTLFISKKEDIRQLCVNRIIFILTIALRESCDTSRISCENVLEAFRIFPAVNLSSYHHLQPEVDVKLVENMLGILESDKEHQTLYEMALRHLALLLRDWRHHEPFLSRDGLSIVSSVLEKALKQKEIKFREELAIQVVGLLKLVCVNSPSARIELSSRETLICHIIAAMSRFVDNDALCLDARIVLGLLVFQNMLKINIQERSALRNQCTILLPESVLKLLALPFICTAHEQRCLSTENPVPGSLKRSELCSVPLRQCWAVNLFGINSLVELTYSEYENFYQGPQWLKLTPLDLTLLRASFIQGMYKTVIYDLQNASNHTVVKDSIHILYECMSLQTLVCGNFQGSMLVWQSLPWDEKLKIFFSVKPTNDADHELLLLMLKFINSTICKQGTADILRPIKWLVSILKSPNAPLTSLLKLDDETEFELWGEILNLVTLVCSAHSDVDYEGNGSSWCFIINSLVDNIELLLSSELMDLELLYAMLPCFTAITSMNGWSSGFPNISHLCHRFVILMQDLLQHFVCQRMPEGFKASFICSYITKHAAMCLRNIVRELVQLWNDETSPTVICYSLGGEETPTTLNVTSVKDLTVCRDVVVRSSAFEALAILCNSSPGRNAMAETLGGSFLPLLVLAHGTLLDQYEADTVRCGAAQLIMNLLLKLLEQDRQQVYTQYEQFITLLQRPEFYTEVRVIAEQLCFAEIAFWDFEEGCLDMNTTKKYCCTFSVEGIPPKSRTKPTSSPTLLKYMCVIIKILITWDCDQILEHLEKCEVVLTLFKCMQVIPCGLYGSKPSALYMHTLEMCIEICSLLSLYLQERVDFFSTTSDIYCCMESIGFLLEPFVYSTEPSQAVILRNKLWCAVFGLITNVIRNHDGFHIFMDVTSRIKYRDNFYMTVVLAMKSGSPTLVQKALNTLSGYLELISTSFPEESSTALDEQGTVKCRDCPKDTQSDSLFKMGVLKLKNSSLPLTIVLCEQTQKIFQIKFEETKASYLLKFELLICLTNLCVISDEAVKLCIDNDLTEIALMEITHVHKFLEGQSVMDSLASKRAIKGLKLILSFLGNLLKHPEAKKRARHNSFAQQIAVIWPLLSSFTELRNLTLKAICNFSVNFKEGMESLLETGTTPCVNVLQLTFHLLLDEMEEVSKHLPVYDIECAYYASKILENTMHSSRCRSFIRRCVQNVDLDILINLVIKCRKGGHHLVKHLLEFLCKFTSYAEGQQAFLQVPKIIEFVMTLLEYPDKQIRELSLIILYNLTTVEKIKLAVMNDKCLKTFQNIMKRGSVEEKFTILNVVQNLIENSTSRKHIFKEYNFPKYIEEFSILLSSQLEDQENIHRLKVVDGILNQFL